MKLLTASDVENLNGSILSSVREKEMKESDEGGTRESERVREIERRVKRDIKREKEKT